ncbi:hypothetical protein BpHYR1_043818 [Brachionus plicatilis]|uniref:Uncharacterized protein n=1 Tax=Brachionus plicatilis TaxID=10195 RepID=A0A3M7RWJ2_BRAPC|nr:hypothetical protein BpHYR1_043818 [Brachionus plicatilis]
MSKLSFYRQKNDNRKKLLDKLSGSKDVNFVQCRQIEENELSTVKISELKKIHLTAKSETGRETKFS